MTRQLRYSTVTCITDLGLQDESVGLIHSILRDRCRTDPSQNASPHSQLAVVDLSHNISPSDTKAAALMLARSVPYLAPGVVLASIGRRLERPAIAVSVGGGQSALVGPDNGVLAAAVAAVGGADAAVCINPSRLNQTGAHVDASAYAEADVHTGETDLASSAAPVAALHPARDVLAPAAALLCCGTPLEHLGEPINPALLLPSVIPVPRVEDDGTLVAEVLSVDNSGTAQLNVDRVVLTDFLAGSLADGSAGGDSTDERAGKNADTTAEPLAISFGGEAHLAVLGEPALASSTPAYPASTDPKPGQLLLTEDVHAMLEVIAGGSETAADIGLRVGTEVRFIHPSQVTPSNTLPGEPVTLRTSQPRLDQPRLDQPRLDQASPVRPTQ